MELATELQKSQIAVAIVAIVAMDSCLEADLQRVDANLSLVLPEAKFLGSFTGTKPQLWSLVEKKSIDEFEISTRWCPKL